MRCPAILLLFLAFAACGTLKTALPPAATPRPVVYVISFSKKSIAITQKAAAVINSVAADANRHRWKLVEITGPPTRKARGYNPGLAGPRMVEVQRALAAAGVNDKRILRVVGAAPDLKPQDSGGQRLEIRLVEGRADLARAAP